MGVEVQKPFGDNTTKKTYTDRVPSGAPGAANKAPASAAPGVYGSKADMDYAFGAVNQAQQGFLSNFFGAPKAQAEVAPPVKNITPARTVTIPAITTPSRGIYIGQAPPPGAPPALPQYNAQIAPPVAKPPVVPTPAADVLAYQPAPQPKVPDVIGPRLQVPVNKPPVSPPTIWDRIVSYFSSPNSSQTTAKGKIASNGVGDWSGGSGVGGGVNTGNGSTKGNVGYGSVGGMGGRKNNGLG